MNILRCQIKGFGKLAHLELGFCPGLNLVFAPNESGKSTLQQFLLALLYGQHREDMPHQRRLESWVEPLRPWSATDYGGILWCRLGEGGEREILRTFGKEESRIEIRAGSGEEITSEYERRKNGDVLFALRHLGLPKDLFEAAAVIRENKAGEFHSPETIRDRITNLVQTGDEAHSAGLSLKKLEEALEELGSDRAPTKPFRIFSEQLRALQEEKRELETRWTEFQEWVQERNAFGADLVRLEQEERAARQEVIASRWKESVQKITALEKMEAELRMLRQEIAAGTAYADFPVHLLEELNRLVAARGSHEQRLSKVHGALAEAEDQLQIIEAKRKGFESYRALDSEGAAERVTEWFAQYKSLSGQIRTVEEGLERLRAESAALQEELERLGPAFHEPGVDWQEKAQQADEAEREANQRQIVLTEELSGKGDALVEEQGAVIRNRSWGSTSLILAIAAAAGTLVLFASSFAPMVIGSAVALALAAGSFVFFRAASRSKVSASSIQSEMNRLKAEQGRLKDDVQKFHFEIGIASAAAGFREVRDFLAAAERVGTIRHRLKDLQEWIAEAEQLRGRLVSESDGLFSNAQAVFLRLGLECKVDELEEKVDILRENLRRFRTMDSEFQNCSQKVGFLREEDARLQEEWSRADLRIREILAESCQVSPEAFRQACRKHELFSTLKEKEALLLREYEARSGNRTLDEWKERLELIKSQLQDSTSELPAPLPVEEAERREREVTAQLASTRENHSRLVERIGQAFSNYRSPSEIEEDIVLAEITLQQITKNRNALTIALETLQELSRRQREDLAPRLNSAVEERFLRLCGGRYREVKIDPQFHIWVRERESGELRGAEALSRGTQDQLYFALRFGILDLVSSGDEACPCLLDEPFAAYDRVRLEEAFQILKEEAERRQLVLFTCRDDLREIALSHDAHLVALPF